MKTSRISRETARIVNALSPPKRITRWSRGFSHNATNEPEIDQSESPISSPLSSPDTKRSLGKRKRESTATPATSISLESTEVRRSPRKAPKLEDDSAPKRKPKRQPAKHIKTEDGEVKVEPPPNWEEVYNITAEMRKKVVAPVDTMGCESLAEEHVAPETKRLQTLISLMLSSQTKDTVNAVAMRNLQQNLPGGFNLQALLDVEPAELNRLIHQVGFHNNKTKFIKAAAIILRDQYGGDIPDTIEGLTSLPGVGPKMAYLCMSAAWGRDEGIGVDVHVHRITNLWGWHKTNTPEQTRAELESWLPRSKWHDINHLLVGFGQTICKPVGRDCAECELGVRRMCPGASYKVSPRKRKVKKEIEMKGEGGEVIKEEEVVVEADDAGATVHIKSEDVGVVDMQASIPDIEEIGAGSIRKIAESVKQEG